MSNSTLVILRWKSLRVARASGATFSKGAFIAKVIIMIFPGHAGHSIESMASR